MKDGINLNELLIEVPYQTWMALVTRDVLNMDLIERFRKEVVKEYVRSKEKGYGGYLQTDEIAEFFGFDLPEVKAKIDEGEQE